MSKKNIVFYGHGSSLNHGCEAIVKTTSTMLKNIIPDLQIDLSTLDYENDCKCFNTIDNYIINRDIKSNLWFKAILYLNSKFCPSKSFRSYYRYKEFRREIKNYNNNTIFISVGGDNYCTSDPLWLYDQNKRIDSIGADRVLWGASVEPKTISKAMMEDLNGYKAIFTRESITKKALEDNNYRGKIYFRPDPAFTLKRDISQIPEQMQNEEWIGINLSPVIISCENVKGVTAKSYESLIDHIISNTNYNVALIPHVVINGNSDFDAMTYLYKKFKNTNRVLQIGKEFTANQYKGIISKCSLFIGARTHATIAAYSSCVPTIVIGYSVKAKGIARDIFGDEEDYVIPVQNITDEEVIIKSFDEAIKRIVSDKQLLNSKMPKIIQNSFCLADDFKKEFNL